MEFLGDFPDNLLCKVVLRTLNEGIALGIAIPSGTAFKVND